MSGKSIYIKDSEYFNAIDLEDKAYWFGFICADGNVSKNEKVLSITLSLVDKAHLNKWKDCVKYNGPVYEGKNGKNRYCKVSITSPKLCHDLIVKGCIPRKTWNMDISLVLSNVPEDLKRHFWRGFVDGDGWVTKESTESKQFVIGLCAFKKDICLEFAKFLVKNGVDTPVEPLKERKIWQKSIKGIRKTKLIANLLYQDATIFLDRKMEVINEILITEPKRRKVLDLLNKKNVETKYEELKDWGSVAKALNVSKGNLYQFRINFTDYKFQKTEERQFAYKDIWCPELSRSFKDVNEIVDLLGCRKSSILKAVSGARKTYKKMRFIPMDKGIVPSPYASLRPEG